MSMALRHSQMDLVSLVLWRFVDPDLLGGTERFRGRPHEAFRVRLIRGIEHDLPTLNHGRSSAVVNHRWREKLDPGVSVLLVIPGEGALTEGAAVLDAASARPHFLWLIRVRQPSASSSRGST